MQDSLATVVDSLVRHSVAAYDSARTTTAATPPSPDDALKGWTLLLAIWGAGLSTLLGIRTLWLDRRRLRVSCSAAFASLPTGETCEFIVITAVNVGKRLVEVRTAELLLNNREKYTQPVSRMGPQPFNRRLEDGESVSFHLDLDELLRSAAKLDRGVRFERAIVTDAEGRRHAVRLRKGMREALNRHRKKPVP